MISEVARLSLTFERTSRYANLRFERLTTNHAALQELARRCDTLIRLVEKENEEAEAVEREERKKTTGKRPGASGSRATDSSGPASKKQKTAAGGAAGTSKKR